jgi:hypothetical protein
LVGDRVEDEFRDLEIIVLVEQEILRLEVAMEDATRVAKSNGGDQLLEVLSSCVLLEPALGDLVE